MQSLVFALLPKPQDDHLQNIVIAHKCNLAPVSQNYMIVVAFHPLGAILGTSLYFEWKSWVVATAGWWR